MGFWWVPLLGRGREEGRLEPDPDRGPGAGGVLGS